MNGVGGLLNDSQQAFFKEACGATMVRVFRMYVPTRDWVEFTVIFRDSDNDKVRIDFVEHSSVLESMDASHSEWYLVGRTVQIIKSLTE